ncbi:MAG: hypothetical protein D6790_16665, partial [Caldilineae bacterium]
MAKGKKIGRKERRAQQRAQRRNQRLLWSVGGLVVFAAFIFVLWRQTVGGGSALPAADVPDPFLGAEA